MHVSPNNKRYIGITCQEDPKRRWGSNGCGYIDNEYFWRAIKKYGWQNFKHEILFDGLTEKEAKQKEIELIALYEIMKNTDGVYGGRFSGAGFKGCCMAIIDPAFEDGATMTQCREYSGLTSDNDQRIMTAANFPAILVSRKSNGTDVRN